MSTGAIPSPAQAIVGTRTTDAASDKNALQLGQVLFGKVLRVYQDGSYLVDLNGREHVVDSAIPLRQDEVFRGKIVGLNEHVVLEKMVSAGTTEIAADSADTLIGQLDQLGQPLNADLQTFINQHYKTFDAATWKILVRLAHQGKQAHIVLATAVYLQKLGLPLNPALIAKLADHLAQEHQLKTLLPQNALHLQIDSPATQSLAQGVAQSTAAIQMLADYLQEESEESLDRARELLRQHKLDRSNMNGNSSADTDASPITPAKEKVSDTPGQHLDQAIFQWLMNTQNGGAVSHRLIVLPLVLNGKLVELEMALFDQNDHSDQASGLKQKVVHLSLQTEPLGKINATINIVNQSLRLHFSSDSETGVSLLAAHNQELSRSLQVLGCRLDEQSYAVNPAAQHEHITRPILHRIVNSNTLSMLV